MIQKKKDNQSLFEDMNTHLLQDDKPSIYFEKIVITDFFLTEPLSLFNALKHTPQCKKYHPEGNVWNHTMLVIDQAALVKHKSKNPKVFLWASLLHDIGKPPTTQIKNGKITSYNHDVVGANLAKTLLDYFMQDIDFVKEVQSLVRFHMQILFVVKNTRFAQIKAMKLQSDLEEVALLGLCDRLGRLDVDENLEKQNVAEFLRKCKIA